MEIGPAKKKVTVFSCVAEMVRIKKLTVLGSVSISVVKIYLEGNGGIVNGKSSGECCCFYTTEFARKYGSKNELKDAMEGARKHFKAKRFDSSIEAFDEILKENPEAAQAFIGKGNALAGKGDFEQALACYT